MSFIKLFRLPYRVESKGELEIKNQTRQITNSSVIETLKAEFKSADIKNISERYSNLKNFLESYNSKPSVKLIASLSYEDCGDLFFYYKNYSQALICYSRSFFTDRNDEVVSKYHLCCSEIIKPKEDKDSSEEISSDESLTDDEQSYCIDSDGYDTEVSGSDYLSDE